MRRLIIAKTYYQMITAIQLKLTFFKKDKVVLLVSDDSRDAETICKELKKEGLFEDVIFFVTEYRWRMSRPRIERIVDCIDISFRKHNRYEFFLKNLKDRRFDEVMVYNFTIEQYGLYSLLADANPRIRFSLFEEGVFSYDFIELETNRRKFIRTLRKAVLRPNITDAYKNYYCFRPELYSGPLTPKKIPDIDPKGRLPVILKNIFKIKESDLSFPEKYIFFASMIDAECSKPVGEYDLVKRIIQAVGKENIVIKIHPRDRRGLYEKSGLRVINNAYVPWEAIQLNADLHDKVYLTVNSTSVMSALTSPEKGIKAYFMYNLCRSQGDDFVKTLTYRIGKIVRRFNKEGAYNIKVVNSLDEILQ